MKSKVSIASCSISAFWDGVRCLIVGRLPMALGVDAGREEGGVPGIAVVSGRDARACCSE